MNHPKFCMSTSTPEMAIEYYKDGNYYCMNIAYKELDYLQVHLKMPSVAWEQLKMGIEVMLRE